MLFSRHEDLEDRIVRLLLNERLSIASLHDRLGDDITLRAVYKASAKLSKAGVLLKVGKRVLLDEEWRGRVEGELGGRPMVLPAPGERETHTFTSIEHLDAFWTTIVLPLERLAPKEIFFYNPHNFWTYIPERVESERSYYEHFARVGRYAFFTGGGDTTADREFKRAFQNENFQVDLRPIPALGRRDHITVIGDLVITVRLSAKLAAGIDGLYERGLPTEQTLPGLLGLCRAPGTIRFVLENNGRKAAKIRRILAKNFYFANI